MASDWSFAAAVRGRGLATRIGETKKHWRGGNRSGTVGRLLESMAPST